MTGPARKLEQEIFNAYAYFKQKTNGLLPNRLILHPSIKYRLLQNRDEFYTGYNAEHFMGLRTVESVNVHEFEWAYVVEG